MSIVPQRLSNQKLTARDPNRFLYDDFLLEGVFQCCEGRIVRTNKSFTKMFGYNSQREVINRPAIYFCADDEAGHFVIDFIHAHEVINRHRLLCKTKNGRAFWGLLSGRKLVVKNKILFEGSILDISNQVTVEEELKLKQIELDKLSMELDRFIYSASHDIRSPISTILGIINLMKLDLKSKDAKEYIHMLEGSMNKLDQFVKELVEYAKNSKTIIEDAPIDCKQIIDEILHELSYSHESFSRLSVSIEVSPSYIFYSDPNRIKLILRSVLRNSLDYHDVNKSNNILLVHASIEVDKARIEIFDNGIGISPQHLNRVFEMFYRATNLSKGSGIGLYTAREAAVKLGGFITIDSEFSVGTLVKVEIPNSKKGRLINKKNLLRVAK